VKRTVFSLNYSTLCIITREMKLFSRFTGFHDPACIVEEMYPIIPGELLIMSISVQGRIRRSNYHPDTGQNPLFGISVGKMTFIFAFWQPF